MQKTQPSVWGRQLVGRGLCWVRMRVDWWSPRTLGTLGPIQQKIIGQEHECNSNFSVFFKLQQYRSGIWGIFVPRSTSRSFQRPVQNSKGLRGKLFYILELYNAVSKNDTNYDQHSNIWSRYTAREVFSRSELWKRDSERAAHASPQASPHGAQWAAHHCWWLLSKLRQEAQLQEIKHGAQSTDTAHAKTISILNRWDFSLCRHRLWIWESVILLFRVIFY